VVLGVVLAFPSRDALGAWLWLPALLSGVLLHLGANLLNDLGDYESGADRPGSPGGSGVLTERLLTTAQVERAAWTCLSLAALSGAALVVARGLPMLALGSFGLLGGWGYTAGPRFKYLGLGDLVVFATMGPLLVLGGYVAVSGQVGWTPVLASIPVGLLVTAALHANNVRDQETDRAGGIFTAAIRLGRAGSLRYFAVLVYGAYACAALLSLARVLSLGALLPLASLPLAVRLSRALGEARTPQARLEAALEERAAALHLAFGLTLIAGCTAGPWIGL
jgi:1,4-dihydroxy-2-naphthoate octaprenyltransferase